VRVSLRPGAVSGGRRARAARVPRRPAHAGQSGLRLHRFEWNRPL